MEYEKIAKEQLKSWLESGEEVLVVDLMNPEFYAAGHIKGAQNAPVYEVAFLDHMAKLTEDKNRHIVLYDDNRKPFASEDAVMKLAGAGYNNVEVLAENFSQWLEAGYPVEKGEPLKIVAPRDGAHELDLEQSVVGWVGRNAKYAHHGKINLKSGIVEWLDGALSKGECVLDMTTIADEDLTDPLWKGILETHLKSSDFFDVANHPEAKFTFAKVKKLENALPGTPNCKIFGELTIKGITNSVEFTAMVLPMEDGSINGQAHFDFDRTAWHVRYGSEKFFEKLGMHLVNDLVSVELFLVAKP